MQIFIPLDMQARRQNRARTIRERLKTSDHQTWSEHYPVALHLRVLLPRPRRSRRSLSQVPSGRDGYVDTIVRAVKQALVPAVVAYRRQFVEQRVTTSWMLSDESPGVEVTVLDTVPIRTTEHWQLVLVPPGFDLGALDPCPLASCAHRGTEHLGDMCGHPGCPCGDTAHRLCDEAATWAMAYRKGSISTAEMVARGFSLIDDMREIHDSEKI